MVTNSGDDVGIGGFIVTGTNAKRVIVRGIGPSLAVNGQPVAERLDDPIIELHDGQGRTIGINDNWRTSQEAEIQETGLAPTNDRESAIVAPLAPGSYTVIIRGFHNEGGIGLIEAYDLDPTNAGELGNLAVRATVRVDDNVLFDGVIVRGGSPKRFVFRALGPSLAVNGTPVAGRLNDPTLELHDANGGLLASNNNWQEAGNASEIQASTLAPPDDRESAILLSLGAGNYTTIVRGVNRTTGIALAEAYKLQN